MVHRGLSPASTDATEMAPTERAVVPRLATPTGATLSIRAPFGALTGDAAVSDRAIKWVWQWALPVTEKLVLLALADAVDERGTCSLSVSTLAAQCSVSPRTVQRLLHELEMKKRIERERQHRTDGSSAANRFRLPVEELREMTPLRDSGVAGDRDGCQGGPGAGVMVGGFRNEPVADWKPMQTEKLELPIDSARAASSRTANAAAEAQVTPATPRKPRFPELARVIG